MIHRGIQIDGLAVVCSLLLLVGLGMMGYACSPQGDPVPTVFSPVVLFLTSIILASMLALGLGIMFGRAWKRGEGLGDRERGRLVLGASERRYRRSSRPPGMVS